MRTNPEKLALIEELKASMKRDDEVFDRIFVNMAEINRGLDECVRLVESKIAARKDAPRRSIQ